MDTAALVAAVTALALNALAATLILIVGALLAGWAARFVRDRSEASPRIDRTLARLFAQLARYAILAFTVLAVLARFGIQTASLVAVVGALGLALGLAMQGALGHLAAGVLLLMLRPFAADDAVEVAGTTGTVEELGLISTKLRTFDGVVVYQPNGNVLAGEIKNYSRAELRRFDLAVGVAYDTDLGAALDAARGVLAEEARVLAEPEPLVAVQSLDDDAVTLLVRGWTLPDELWTVRYDLMRGLKERFAEAGLEIPFPQRDLHLRQVEPLEVKQVG